MSICRSFGGVLRFAVCGIIMAIPGSVSAVAVFSGPTPYLSPADSHFSGQIFNYFHLEDFEDGLLNTPGVTANPNWTVFSFGGFRDSVDADDGAIDGSGSRGRSFVSNFQSSPLTFTFDAAALGGNLPTHVGIVWTDVGINGGGSGPGSQPVTFSAQDNVGNVLGTIGPFLLGDTSITGQTAEDRFFGVFNPAGISSITISMPGLNNWEIDHLQYGFAPVPLPPRPVEAELATPQTPIRCAASGCAVPIICNLSESQGTACSNPVDLFVRRAAARFTDVAPLKAPKRIRFASGIANVPPGQMAEVRLRLTKKGRDILRTSKKRRLNGIIEIRNTPGTVFERTAIKIRLRRR